MSMMDDEGAEAEEDGRRERRAPLIRAEARMRKREAGSAKTLPEHEHVCSVSGEGKGTAGAEDPIKNNPYPDTNRQIDLRRI